MQNEPPSATNEIRWRPGNGNWILVIASVLLSVFAPWLPSENITSRIFLLTLAFINGLWILRTTIIADEEGIRRRGLFGSYRRNSWEEVKDYYEVLTDKPSKRACVVTTKGVWYLPSEKTEQLRTFITKHASAALASEWAIFETRPCDQWPRVYSYKKTNPFGIALFVAVIMIIWPLIFFSTKSSENITGIVAFLGWPAKFLFILVTTAFFLLPVVVFAGIWQDVRHKNRRLSHKITVDLSGTIFEDDHSRIQARWDEVTYYYISPGWPDVYVIETAHGKWDFLEALDSKTLPYIIERYATAVSIPGWRKKAP